MKEIKKMKRHLSSKNRKINTRSTVSKLWHGLSGNADIEKAATEKLKKDIKALEKKLQSAPQKAKKAIVKKIVVKEKLLGNLSGKDVGKAITAVILALGLGAGIYGYGKSETLEEASAEEASASTSTKQNTPKEAIKYLTAAATSTAASTPTKQNTPKEASTSTAASPSTTATLQRRKDRVDKRADKCLDDTSSLKEWNELYCDTFIGLGKDGKDNKSIEPEVKAKLVKHRAKLAKTKWDDLQYDELGNLFKSGDKDTQNTFTRKRKALHNEQKMVNAMAPSLVASFVNAAAANIKKEKK